jgi:hypothetical protein
MGLRPTESCVVVTDDKRPGVRKRLRDVLVVLVERLVVRER